MIMIQIVSTETSTFIEFLVDDFLSLLMFCMSCSMQPRFKKSGEEAISKIG